MNITRKSECKVSFTNDSDHRQNYLEIYLNSRHKKKIIIIITKTIYTILIHFEIYLNTHCCKYRKQKDTQANTQELNKKTHKISNSRTFLDLKSTIFFSFYPAIISKLFNSYILYIGHTDTDYTCNLILFFFVQNYMYFF